MFNNPGQNQPTDQHMFWQINVAPTLGPTSNNIGIDSPASGSGQALPSAIHNENKCHSCKKILAEWLPVPLQVPHCCLNIAPPVKCCGPAVEWVTSNANDVHKLSDRAVVAGFEKHNGSALWVIRGKYEGHLIPGKLVLTHKAAYVGWAGEHAVKEFEVCCARPERIMWQVGRNGHVPPTAIVAGRTANGEPLYVGRAFQEGSQTPGKIHPSYQKLYIPFYGREADHTEYEVLCAVNVVHLCTCPCV
ncbi:uncharacterized protein LOC118269539 [Spodoptera frugiperda]|uniref:Uncharacterized protein LOC118269539 n=1 Tax=Spodoptera frugiperda TaxID=7108 RepID=A0A9R0EK76_SPOFR|nr:uncharacterized protein LOC118269539 [Spodoptera frugiperda]